MGVKWTRKPTQIPLDQRFAALEREVEAIADESGLAMEAHAKVNAPWNDDTGAARNGLFHAVDRDGDRLRISICHSVDYGVELELARGGKYAILWPTVEAEVPNLREALKGLLGS